MIAPNGEEILAAQPDYTLLKQELLRATAKVTRTGSYTPATTITLLDKLLDKDYLTAEQYLTLLPSGSIGNIDTLLELIKTKGVTSDE